MATPVFTFPLAAHPPLAFGTQVNRLDDQPLTRLASIHIDGLALVDDMGDDGSNVGKNGNPADDGLVGPGKTATYKFLDS